MKFVVIKDPLGTVDVRLHWETKEKLKRAGLCALYATSVVVCVVAFRR